MRVLTLGSFDMLHPGHLGLFAWCTRIAMNGIHPNGYSDDPGTVVAAVNTDEFVTRFKTAPRYSTEERMAMVKALKGVDEVVENDGFNQAALILRVDPDLLIIGSDWARKDYLAQLSINQDWLDAHGIGLVYVPRTGGWSSTELRARGRQSG